MRKNDTEQIRLENRRLIINYLRVHAPIARIDIGKALNLSPATVTAITSELSKDDRIVEIPTVTDKEVIRGRPRVLIDLAPNAYFVIGLKISIGELRLTLGNHKGALVKEEIIKLQTLELSVDGLIEAIAGALHSFIAQLSGQQKPKAIGIAFQGVINGLTGEIIWSPAISGKHVNIKDRLQKIVGLPITIANDANCLTIAIRHKPKYQHLKNFSVVMLGYGVGMGMIINNELYLGHHGAAAEFGHTKHNPNGAQCLCGKRGCIEAYVGDYALYQDARSITPLPLEDHLHPSEESMEYLVSLASDNHPGLIDLLDRAGKILGFGLANIIALMSPEKIIISGPGVRAYKFLEDGIREGLESALVKELIADTTLDKVDWSEDLTVVGVVALALQSIE